VLSHDVVSHASTPISAADVLGHQCTLESSVLPHLSTMPDLYLRLTSSNRGKQQTRQPLITSTNGLDVTPESGSSTRSR
jgi:hypothetical protein